jgi:hypothetical protein
MPAACWKGYLPLAWLLITARHSLLYLLADFSLDGLPKEWKGVGARSRGRKRYKYRYEVECVTDMPIGCILNR